MSTLSQILAYVDPGSGLLIWQAVVAAVIGVLFYLKKTRDFIFGLCRSLFNKDRKK